jgi:hypothetical protein
MANAAPAARHIHSPVQGSFYDGHKDAIVVTDSSGRRRRT